MLLPYEYEWSCIPCGYNVSKQKHELTKIQQKRIIFVNQLKYAENKRIYICTDKYKIYEVDDFDKRFEILSTLLNEKIKLNNIIIQKKDLLENCNFEQDSWSRTAIGRYKIGRDSIRLMKWLAYYDRPYYENINYYDVMASVLICLKNEISDKQIQ